MMPVEIVVRAAAKYFWCRMRVVQLVCIVIANYYSPPVNVI